MFELYVCDGVLSVVAFVGVSPVPQSMLYLLAPPPTVVMVRVTFRPAEPAVTSAVKSTDLTYVLFLMFSIVSFRSSNASVTEDAEPKLTKAPSPKLESAGVPTVTFVPTTPPPAAFASKYLLVTKSSAAVGSAPASLAYAESVMVEVVDPSDVVVTSLNLSVDSSQYSTAGFPADPLLIKIPAELAVLEPEFSVRILSSTVKFLESTVVVEPVTVKSPVTSTSFWNLAVPLTSNLYAPGESVPIPIRPLLTSR